MNSLRVIAPYIRAVFIASGLVSMVGLLSGCPQLREWRDRQIQTSHSLAAAPQKVQTPSQPVKVPSDVEKVMPFDASFAILSYFRNGKTHHVSVLSSWAVEPTVQWVLAEMASRNYELTDNPSRILEGVDFTNSQGKFSSINIKIELNSANQTLITCILTES